MAGKSIRVFLVDGVASGIMTAEIMNWTGKVIVAPRSQLGPFGLRSESRRTGIYILAGDDPTSSLKEQVYIGESDNVFSRLTNHNNDPSKYFWSRTLAIISKDENLTKSHVRYLESQLIRVAKTANRATIINGTAPPLPNLPEPDIADMEFFLEQLLLLLPVLNFSFAIPIPTISASSIPSADNSTAEVLSQSASPIFTASGTNYSAEAQEINGQFIVLKGSRPKIGGGASFVRDDYLKDGRLVHHANGVSLELTTDISFQSPSGAAKFILGTAVNGREFWKVRGTNQTYNKWDQSRIDSTIQATSTGNTDITSS